MPELDTSLHALVGLTLVIAVVTDVRARRIPDLLTYPAMVLALVLRVSAAGVGDVGTGLISGLIGLAAAGGWFSIFALRKQGLGWGDVKLAMVVGAALGVPLTAVAVVFISIAGALQAVVSLIWKGALSATVRAALSRKAEGEKHIPYGVAIALGSLGAMWWDGNAF